MIQMTELLPITLAKSLVTIKNMLLVSSLNGLNILRWFSRCGLVFPYFKTYLTTDVYVCFY